MSCSQIQVVIVGYDRLINEKLWVFRLYGNRIPGIVPSAVISERHPDNLNILEVWEFRITLE